MSFSLGIALALSAVLSTSTLQTQGLTQPMPQAQTVEQYVDNYFADEPVMISVAECESHFHQFSSDGSVYRGKIDNQDVGVMQINEHYQGAMAQKLGINIYTLQGNVAYAQYLYEKQGTAPWSSSEACWSKTQAQTLAIADTK